MFQYCYGRIIAEKLKTSLFANQINGFVNTGNVCVDSNYNCAGSFIVPKYGIHPNTIVNEHSNTNIAVYGWYQKYDFYRDYADVIKNGWMFVEPLCGISQNDVVMHIRLGDYNKLGWHLPISYYEDCLQNMQYVKLWICTDEPKHAMIEHFVNKWNATIVSTDRISDLRFMMAFDKIVMSRSTYSWWAAFLSNASDICFPNPDVGFWSDSDQDHALFVNDQQRFRKVPCTITHACT